MLQEIGIAPTQCAVIDKKYLEAALNAASEIASKRSVNPVAEMTRIVAAFGTITFEASNFFTGVSYTVPAPGNLHFITCINTKILTDLVKALPVSSVEISYTPSEANCESGTLTLRTSKSRARFKTNSAEHFPIMPSIPAKAMPFATVEADLLKEIVSDVAFAAADDNTRPAFAGISWEPADDTLNCYCSDSYRVAHRLIPIEKVKSTGMEKLLFDAKEMQHITKILPAGAEVVMHMIQQGVAVSFEAKQVIDRGEYPIRVYTRLLDSQFPNVQSVYKVRDAKRAAGQMTTAKVSSHDLRAAGKTTSILADEKDQIIRMRLEPQFDEIPGCIRMQASQENAEGGDEVPAEVTGPGGEISLNSKLFMPMLGAGDFAPDVTIENAGKNNPIFITSVYGERVANYVQMPLIINK